MPLKESKSAAAFKDNLRKEYLAGKPIAQALAISYAEKRKATERDKKKK